MTWNIIEQLSLDRDYSGLIKEFRSGRSCPNERDDMGSPLLLNACGVADVPLVFILLALGADVNIYNHSQETALGYLCSYNDFDEEARTVIATALLGMGHRLESAAYPNGYADIAIRNRMYKLALVLNNPYTHTVDPTLPEPNPDSGGY